MDIFSLLNNTINDHLSSCTSDERKKMLSLLNDRDKWQALIEGAVTRTEEAIFLDEFACDVATVSTAKLQGIENPSHVILLELSKRDYRSIVRNAFELWATTGTEPDKDIFESKMFRAYMWCNDVVLVKHFNDTFRDWNIHLIKDKLLEFCKNIDEQTRDADMWNRIINHNVHDFIDWFKEALEFGRHGEINRIIQLGIQMVEYLTNSQVKQIKTIALGEYKRMGEDLRYINIQYWIDISKSVKQLVDKSVHAIVHDVFAQGIKHACGSINVEDVKQVDDENMMHILYSYSHLKK